MLLMGGGRRDEEISTIQKAAETGGAGGARLSCNAKRQSSKTVAIPDRGWNPTTS